MGYLATSHISSPQSANVVISHRSPDSAAVAFKLPSVDQSYATTEEIESSIVRLTVHDSHQATIN